jgi:hypothetical protein
MTIDEIMRPGELMKALGDGVKLLDELIAACEAELLAQAESNNELFGELLPKVERP